MPRKKLTDVEKAERKKRQWDPAFQKKTDFRGKQEDWAEAGRLLLEKMGRLNQADLKKYLDILGLEKIPANQPDLQRARRQAMRHAHPDLGGSEKAAKLINEAFLKLQKEII